MRYEQRKVLLGTTVAMAVMIPVILFRFIFTSSNPLLWAIISGIITGFAASASILVSRRLVTKREQERRQVFLLYASEDIDFARKLASDLKERGFNPWLDVEQITPGQIWQKSVMRALEESTVAIVLVSEHLSSKKGFVQKELKVALETLQEQKQDMSPVIPVRIDESKVPEIFSHIHWVNFFEEGGIDRLVSGLNKIFA